MSKKIIIAALVVCLASCSVEKSEQFSSNLYESSLSVNEEAKSFGASLNSVATTLNNDSVMLNNFLYNDYQVETRGGVAINANLENQAKRLISGLVFQSDSFLRSLNLSDVNKLSDSEKVEVALLLYAEYMTDYKIYTRGGKITGNHYVECALSALGITDISQIASDGLIKYAKRVGAKTFLKTAAKFAGKTVSWVGWGLVVYDFMTCL